MVQLGITLKNAVGTTNAYSQDVEDALVQFFPSSGLGRQLLHSIYTRVKPGADKQRSNQFLRSHSDSQCSPEEAVALLLDLGIPRRRLRVLSRFICKRAEVWYKQTGPRVGKPMPGRLRFNLAWKRMKEPLHLVGHIDKKTGIRNVSGPFDHWINYVFTQPCLFETLQPSNDGFVFNLSGDGYPVAGVRWTQLTIPIRHHEHLARNAAHIWVLELAYCGDSNMRDSRRVWKTNLRVCYFFEYCLRSNLRPFERSFSFERTCFSNKIFIALCTLLGPAADHNWAIRRREGRALFALFRAHCLPDTRSHYLIISEFDVPRILEAIAPYGLGMYCQDLAETTNAKLKDFYLRFANRGGNTTDDYQLSALLQSMEHAFLYTHSHNVAHDTTGPISCPNAALPDSLIDDAAQWC